MPSVRQEARIIERLRIIEMAKQESVTPSGRLHGWLTPTYRSRKEQTTPRSPQAGSTGG